MEKEERGPRGGTKIPKEHVPKRQGLLESEAELESRVGVVWEELRGAGYQQGP